jgi:hypothetical protein
MKSKNMKLNTALAAAIVMALSTVVTGAHADDWKGYAGVSCLPSSENADIRRSVSGLRPAFANMGARTTAALCPIVRDVSEGGPNRLELVRVRVRDRHPQFNVRCVLRSHSIDGAVVDLDEDSTVGTGIQTLSMGPLDANNWGSYTLICSLPGRGEQPNQHLSSYIINYRVDESTL